MECYVGHRSCPIRITHILRAHSSRLRPLHKTIQNHTKPYKTLQNQVMTQECTEFIEDELRHAPFSLLLSFLSGSTTAAVPADADSFAVGGKEVAAPASQLHATTGRRATS